MRCPYCKAWDDIYRHRVLRKIDYGFAIKRYRRCWKCKRTFHSYEEYDQDELKEIKNNGQTYYIKARIRAY